MNFRNNLSIQNTKLAHQRTYLSYVRTGFAISSIAGTFKKYYFAIFGLIMILVSSAQYYFAINNLNNSKITNYIIFDYIPLVYIPILIIILH